MKYRDAKNLHNGDEVTSKESGVTYLVSSIEVYAQVKYVRINCLHTEGASVSFLHDEIE